jgi:hypothetical protein
MSRLAARLSDAGFIVDNLDYPSTRETFDEPVAGLARAMERDSASCPKIHFVGYSVGARGSWTASSRSSGSTDRLELSLGK